MTEKSKLFSGNFFLILLLNTTLFSYVTCHVVGAPKDEYEQCAVSVGCFGIDKRGIPNACIESKNCLILATYQMQNSSGDVTFTLMGDSDQSMYIALGLSKDNGDMGDDSVMFCYNTIDQTTTNNTGMSWNLAGRIGSTILKDDPQNYLRNISSSYVDGKLSCRFTRLHITDIPIPPEQSETIQYNLSMPYYLQLAMGRITVNDDNKLQGLKMHSIRGKSNDEVYFNTVNKMQSGDDNTKSLITAHASLMVIAWMFFACIGSFTAGYMFAGFPENAGFYWFRIHQICMSLTWLLSITSMLAMFVGRGFTPLMKETLAPHALIGLFAILFTFVQPFMGFLRPSPASKRRDLFNYTHRTVGHIAILLALTALQLSSYLKAAMLEPEARYVSGGFLLYYYLCHVLLTIANRYKRRLKDIVNVGYVLAIVGMFAFLCAFLTYLFKR